MYIIDVQFGFRSKRSTIDAVVKIMNELFMKNNKRKCSAISFLDFQKAFDTIDHDLLQRKLEKYRIRGNVSKLFQNYLKNRNQFV